MLDDRLSLAVTHADGRITKWGPDCPDGKDIPGDLTLTDSIPGGHATLTTNLLRRIDFQHADEALFDRVLCYGPGGRPAWDGYMQQFPRTHGDGFGVSPGAVGWSAVTRWDTGFRERYVDRDLSHWTEATLARKVALSGISFPQGRVPVTIGPGGIIWTPPNEALTTSEVTEVMYDAGPGLAIGNMSYVGSRTSAFTTFEAPAVFSSATETGFASASALTLSGSAQFASFTAQRYLALRTLTTGAVTPTAGAQQSFTGIGLIGDHGLSVHALADASGHYGVFASAVIADIITRAAPQLTYTTGPAGSIPDTTFAIPHLVYSDPVTAEFAISDVNKYHLYDWGVYDNREFFFRPADPDRLLWQARLSDGAHLDADGDTAEQVINGVFVTYTTGDGMQKVVGPPGGPFDDTDTALEDTSSTNPVNSHGLGRKWVPLNLSFPTTLAGATAIGVVYLAERSLAGRRGSVTLTDTATHPTEGKVPCWRPRSGDWITLKDLNGSIVPRKIISKSYTHSNRQVRLDLDNTVAKLDAIMARVGVQAGIATGGGF